MKKINVETRMGRPITNSQITELSQIEKNQNELLINKHPRAIPMSQPYPHYNCHGLTFASRRTGLYQPSEIWNILKDDGYTEVSPQTVTIGDIAVYFDLQDNQVTHTGVVTRGFSSKPILVLSKWGKGAEFLHEFLDCPYIKNANVKFFKLTNGDSHEFTRTTSILVSY